MAAVSSTPPPAHPVMWCVPPPKCFEDDVDALTSALYRVSISSDGALERLEMPCRLRVEASIDGVVGSVKLKMTFHNTSKRNEPELTWAVGLDKDAAITGLQARMHDGRVIKADPMEIVAATKIYEDAKSEGKTTGIATTPRPDVFQMKVAELKAGEAVEITATYVAPLTLIKGGLMFVFPTRLMPRYGASADFPDLPARGSMADAPFIFESAFKIPGGLAGPLVALGTEKDDDVGINGVVCCINKKQLRMVKNIVICAPCADKAGSFRGYFTTSEDGKTGFVVMAVRPEIKPLAAAERSAKLRVTFVLDYSGSMADHGRFTNAKLATKAMLNERPGDLVNVIAFGSDCKSLSTEPQPFNNATVAKCKEFINDLHANSGTDFIQLLETLFKIECKCDKGHAMAKLTAYDASPYPFGGSVQCDVCKAHSINRTYGRAAYFHCNDCKDFDVCTDCAMSPARRSKLAEGKEEKKQQQVEGFCEEYQDAVIILTDGETDHVQKVLSMTRAHKPENMTIHVLGIGLETAGQHFVSSFARVGGGSFTFLTDEMIKNLAVVCKDLVATIKRPSFRRGEITWTDRPEGFPAVFTTPRYIGQMGLAGDGDGFVVLAHVPAGSVTKESLEAFRKSATAHVRLVDSHGRTTTLSLDMSKCEFGKSDKELEAGRRALVGRSIIRESDELGVIEGEPSMTDAQITQVSLHSGVLARTTALVWVDEKSGRPADDLNKQASRSVPECEAEEECARGGGTLCGSFGAAPARAAAAVPTFGGFGPPAAAAAAPSKGPARARAMAPQMMMMGRGAAPEKKKSKSKGPSKRASPSKQQESKSAPDDGDMDGEEEEDCSDAEEDTKVDIDAIVELLMDLFDVDLGCFNHSDEGAKLVAAAINEGKRQPKNKSKKQKQTAAQARIDMTRRVLEFLDARKELHRQFDSMMARARVWLTAATAVAVAA